MTERKIRVGFLVLIAVLVACVVLYVSALRSREALQQRIDKMVVESLAESSESFHDYQSSPSHRRESYLYGTSAFFQAKNLYAETSYYNSQMAAAYSEAVRKLMMNEDLEQKELEFLLEALDYLKEDPSDIRAYTCLDQFLNAALYE